MKKKFYIQSYLIRLRSVFFEIRYCGSGYTSHISNRPVLICFSCLLFVFSSCDQEFQPLEANDEFFFSMYGYLDAAADTQWIHITPVREQVDMLDTVPEMEVTLTNVDSGQQITLNDSLFQRGANFLNFWTDEPVEYNQVYRLRAELPTGESSKVTVVTPDEMPLPKIVIFTTPGASPEYFVFVDKRVNLADIQVKYYIRILASNLEQERTISFSYRNSAEITQEFPDYYTVEIKPDEERNAIERQVLLPPEGEIEVVYRQVFVAASGVEWNDEIESLDDVIYALPQTFRNVEDGLGYVIGIDGKYIPYEGCTDENDLFISCGSEDPFWY